MNSLKHRLDTGAFFEILEMLTVSGVWQAYVEKDLIFLRREGSKTIFSPLTAVYFFLTGKEIHHGSFWVDELTSEFGFPWWEILEISYVWMACEAGGKKFNRRLRAKIISTLRLPSEKKFHVSPAWFFPA